jgi:hypothetical protein
MFFKTSVFDRRIRSKLILNPGTGQTEYTTDSNSVEVILERKKMAGHLRNNLTVETSFFNALADRSRGYLLDGLGETYGLTFNEQCELDEQAVSD